MSWKNIIKAYSRDDMLNVWLEINQYIEISCGIYETDCGEPENLNSFAGRMEELKKIILSDEQGNWEEHLDLIERYATVWPLTTQMQLFKLLRRLGSIFQFREENA